VDDGVFRPQLYELADLINKLFVVLEPAFQFLKGEVDKHELQFDYEDIVASADAFRLEFRHLLDRFLHGILEKTAGHTTAHQLRQSRHVKQYILEVVLEEFPAFSRQRCVEYPEVRLVQCYEVLLVLQQALVRFDSLQSAALRKYAADFRVEDASVHNAAGHIHSPTRIVVSLIEKLRKQYALLEMEEPAVRETVVLE
jgi:hypothetical protein